MQIAFNQASPTFAKGRVVAKTQKDGQPIKPLGFLPRGAYKFVPKLLRPKKFAEVKQPDGTVKHLFATGLDALQLRRLKGQRREASKQLKRATSKLNNAFTPDELSKFGMLSFDDLKQYGDLVKAEQEACIKAVWPVATKRAGELQNQGYVRKTADGLALDIIAHPSRYSDVMPDYDIYGHLDAVKANYVDQKNRALEDIVLMSDGKGMSGRELENFVYNRNGLIFDYVALMQHIDAAKKAKRTAEVKRRAKVFSLLA